MSILKIPIQFVDDGRDSQLLTIVDSILSRATLPDINYAGKYEKIPVATYLKGLPRIKPAEGFTRLLMEMLIHFDAQKTVTYIRLGYDNKKKKCRNDCYVTYLNQNSAKLFAGELEPIKHSVYGVEIEASMSKNVPLIMRTSETFRLNNNVAPWSEEIESHNQLIVKQQAPFDHPRRNEVDEYTGDTSLIRFPIVAANNSNERHTSTSSIKPLKVQSTIQKVSFKPSFKPAKLTRTATKDKNKEHAINKDSDINLKINIKAATEKEGPKRIVYDLTEKRRSSKQVELSSDSSTDSDDSDQRLLIDEDVALESE
ncbi:unnamed protein product [Chironomus riparius]|uniref:Uncharacterized protein n=1 Tax=Chironomus riparius TaxID=315576 RepID=A0A9N9RGJ0_9DIPT|nr:unnamed protein product [Chironomus riparius]